MAAMLRGIVEAAKPNLATFVRFAKVELVPPTPAEIGEIAKGVNNIVRSATSGKWKSLTVKEAWLNTLVAVEVACWFYVGEVIGKRHLIGYKVEV